MWGSEIACSFDRIKLFGLISDKPDGKRKIHLKPIPLAGGIILIFNISIYAILTLINPNFLPNELFFNNNFQLLIFIITSIFIFLVGIIDDKYYLSPNLKILSSWTYILDNWNICTVRTFCCLNNTSIIKNFNINNSITFRTSRRNR